MGTLCKHREEIEHKLNEFAATMRLATVQAIGGKDFDALQNPANQMQEFRGQIDGIAAAPVGRIFVDEMKPKPSIKQDLMLQNSDIDKQYREMTECLSQEQQGIKEKLLQEISGNRTSLDNINSELNDIRKELKLQSADIEKICQEVGDAISKEQHYLNDRFTHEIAESRISLNGVNVVLTNIRAELRLQNVDIEKYSQEMCEALSKEQQHLNDRLMQNMTESRQFMKEQSRELAQSNKLEVQALLQKERRDYDGMSKAFQAECQSRFHESSALREEFVRDLNQEKDERLQLEADLRALKEKIQSEGGRHWGSWIF